jgi:hypothetical protein
MALSPSCPNCGYYTMLPLKRFFEDDVHDNPSASGQGVNRGFAAAAPGCSFFFMAGTTLWAIFFGKARQARGRAKVREARELILPRSPESLICPNCFEVLERMKGE